MQTRTALVKKASDLAENARVSIRAARHQGQKDLKTDQDNKVVGDSDARRDSKQVRNRSVLTSWCKHARELMMVVHAASSHTASRRNQEEDGRGGSDTGASEEAVDGRMSTSVHAQTAAHDSGLSPASPNPSGATGQSNLAGDTTASVIDVKLVRLTECFN